MACFHKHSLARLTSLGLTSLAMLPYPTFADTPAGRVMFVHGDASIERDGERTPAKRGDDFFSGDTFHTAQASSLQLRYSDGGTKALRPDSTYTIERYALDEEHPENSVQRGELIRGGLRAITGAIGHATPQNVNYRTPVATMGIRGTSFQLLHVPDGGSPTLPGVESGSYLYVETGLIAMSTDAGDTLVRPGQVFFTPALNSAPRLLPNGIAIFEQLEESSLPSSAEESVASTSIQAATQSDTAQSTFFDNAELIMPVEANAMRSRIRDNQADALPSTSALIQALAEAPNDAPSEGPLETPDEDTDVTDPTPTDNVDPTPVDTVDPAPTDAVDPTPADVVDPTPTDIADPAPADTVNPTPTDNVDPTPTDIADPAPLDTVAPTPTDNVAPTPMDTAAPEPTDTVDPAPVDTVDPTPTDVEDPAPTDTVDPAPIDTTPADVEEPAPTDSANQEPSEDNVDPAPTDVEEPAPTDTANQEPSETTDPAPTSQLSPAQRLGFENAAELLTHGVGGSRESLLGETGQLLVNSDGNQTVATGEATRWQDNALTSVAANGERLQARANATPSNFRVISLSERDATTNSSTVIYWGRWASEDIARLTDDGTALLTPLGNVGDLHYVGSNQVLDFDAMDASEAVSLVERLTSLDPEASKSRINFSLVTPGELTTSEGGLTLRDDSSFALGYEEVNGQNQLHAHARFYLIDDSSGEVYTARSDQPLAAFFLANEGHSQRLTFGEEGDVDGHFTSRFTGRRASDNTEGSIDGVIGNLYAEIRGSGRSAYGSLGFGRDAVDFEISQQGTLVNSAGRSHINNAYRRNILPFQLDRHDVADGEIVWGYWRMNTKVPFLSSLNAPVVFISASRGISDTLSASLGDSALNTLRDQLTKGVTFHWVGGTGLVPNNGGDIIPILDDSFIELASKLGKSSINIAIKLDDFGELQGHKDITSNGEGFETFLLDSIQLTPESCDSPCLEGGEMSGYYVGNDATAIMSLIDAWGDSVNYSGAGVFERK